MCCEEGQDARSSLRSQPPPSARQTRPQPAPPLPAHPHSWPHHPAHPSSQPAVRAA